jgi:hypothetical protein
MNTPVMEAPPEIRLAPSRATFAAPMRVTSMIDRPLGKSRLALCLRRGAAVGLRIVILTPREVTDVMAGPSRFPDRRIKPDAQVFWETGRRVLLGRGSLPHDRQSWHVLVADGDGCIVGTISARFTFGPLATEAVHLLKMAAASGPILHEQCELAVKETHEAAVSAGRGFGEISDWVVSPGEHARLISAMLIRSVAALAAVFDNPICVLPANQFRHEGERLMRRGAAPLGRIGKFCLPPLIDQQTSAWVRMLIVDTAAFHARSGTQMDVEAGLLRRRIAMVSVT